MDGICLPFGRCTPMSGSGSPTITPTYSVVYSVHTSNSADMHRHHHSFPTHPPHHHYHYHHHHHHRDHFHLHLFPFRAAARYITSTSWLSASPSRWAANVYFFSPLLSLPRLLTPPRLQYLEEEAFFLVSLGNDTIREGGSRRLD